MVFAVFFASNALAFLFHGIVFRIPSKGDFVQSLPAPRVKSTPFDELWARTVGFDGPKFQKDPDSALDSVRVLRVRSMGNNKSKERTRTR